MLMVGEQTRQASADVFDYIATLNAAEALGELLHMRQIYAASTAISPVIAGRASELLTPVLFALAERVRDGEGGIAPVVPVEGAVHTCELVGRAVIARMFGL